MQNLNGRRHGIEFGCEDVTRKMTILGFGSHASTTCGKETNKI